MTTIIPIWYKSSPLGPIPSDWSLIRLNELWEISSGGTPDTTNPTYWNGDINWCTPTDITALGNSKFIKGTNTKITNEGLKNSSAKLLPEWSLIVCTRATIGKVAISTIPISTNQWFKNIVPDISKVNVNFLYYQLIFNENNLIRLWNGSTFLEVSKADFELFEIPFPSISEQATIANLLSTWDEAISKVSRLIEQHEKRRKWLIWELLSWERRLKDFDIKWKTIPLSECLEFTPREVPKPENNFLALWIRSHGKWIFHKADFEPEDLAMDVLYVVRKDDLIVNITFAWEQAIAIAWEKDDWGLVSHRFPTYTFKRDTAIPEYFRYIITQEKFKYLLDLISPGGAWRNRVLSKKDFMKLEVTIPDVSEQQEIANILNKSDQEIQLLKSKLEKLREQKKWLMQQLLTGKKRLKF